MVNIPQVYVTPAQESFLIPGEPPKYFYYREDENAARGNKPIDLEKIFTPADDDSGDNTPRNRKMFASSSFYSPLHPTVQDQVQLARRISNSLSDISNMQSKGQSMYVNRMKRSVKWVHGGGENEAFENGEPADNSLPAFKIPNVGPKEVKLSAPPTPPPKDPLKLIMNPLGRVQDINTITKQGVQVQAPLTPEKCFDLVRDLNTTKGRGAELFAKRRKRSEKWVVDETTVKQSSTTTTAVQQQSSVSMLEQTYTQNTQKTQRQEQLKKITEIQEKFGQPRLKLIKSPWEAALETGSVESAFIERAPVFPTPTATAPSPGLPSYNSERLPTSARATPINEGVQKSALLLPNIPRGWGSAQTRQLTYGSVSLKPNQADPVQPITSQDSGVNSQSAATSAPGTALSNQSHTLTPRNAGFKPVKGPQDPRPTSPFPSVFVPGPRSSSPPRDLRRLIHPQSLKSQPTDPPKNQTQESVSANNQINNNTECNSVSETTSVVDQNTSNAEATTIIASVDKINSESRETSRTSIEIVEAYISNDSDDAIKSPADIPTKKPDLPKIEEIIQQTEHKSEEINAQSEVLEELITESTNRGQIPPSDLENQIHSERIEERIDQESTQPTQINQEQQSITDQSVDQGQLSEDIVEEIIEKISSDTGADTNSIDLKLALESAGQLNIEDEIQNIDSEIQSLTKDIESQEIFDSILSEENKFIREKIPTEIVKEIIEEEMIEAKRLAEILRADEEKVAQLKREEEERERRKREEYNKLLLQQEHLKLTPYQIQAREEKNRLKMKHLEETRALGTVHQEEMNKLKAEQARQLADLTMRQQSLKKSSSQHQLKSQFDELTYLQKLQKQKLSQEQFLQQQRLRQQQKIEEKELQEKLDELDFLIQEQTIKQQEEERRILEQLRHEEEMKRLKEEEERLLKIEKEKEEEQRKEKEKFLQQIYKEQCLKMLKEQDRQLSLEEMVEFFLGLGIEMTLDQVEKFDKEIDTEREELRKQQEIETKKIEEEKRRIEEELKMEKVRKTSVTTKPRKNSESEENTSAPTEPERQRKFSEKEVEPPKFKDEAEAEEYVNQQKLRHKQQIEQKLEEERLKKEEQQTIQVEETVIAEDLEEMGREVGNKPASKVIGAVPIFAGGIPTAKSSSNVLLHEELQRKVPQKNPNENESKEESSEVEIGTDSGVVYESKPFKEVFETFEGNARPTTKVKHITDNPEILRSISGVNIHEALHTEITSRTETSNKEETTKSDTFYDVQCRTESRLFEQETTTLGTESLSRAVSRAGSTTRHTELQSVQQLSDLLKHSEPSVLRPLSGLGQRGVTPLPAYQQPAYQEPEYSSPLPTYQSEPVISSFAPQPPPRLYDYTSLNNYNTAPRGWKQNIEYYRPVTFTPSTRVPENAIYSEF